MWLLSDFAGKFVEESLLDLVEDLDEDFTSIIIDFLVYL